MGNFEYRMFLRCRHAAKLRFIKLRSDVLVKLQLLDNKRGMLLVHDRVGIYMCAILRKHREGKMVVTYNEENGMRT